jgi:uncharacterized membrane protein YphA (DoxX/SURF4 family)
VKIPAQAARSINLCNETAPNFPDPLGIGHPASLALVGVAEFFVSLFVFFGLVTCWSALVLAIDMGVAFISIHKGALSGQGSGERAFMYLMGYVTLLLAGPGRFSVDKTLFGKGGYASDDEDLHDAGQLPLREGMDTFAGFWRAV